MQCFCRKITAHMPKNGQKTLEETLEKRSRYRPALRLDALNQQ
jgi:hypothetical protein